MSQRLSPLVRLLLGAVLISFAPILAKWVGKDSVGPTGIGFCRTIIGAGFLFAWARLTGRPLFLSRRALAWSVLTGFLFALDLYTWHHAIYGCGAGMATILGNTQVFWTALLGFVVFREVLSRRFWPATIAAMIGIVLLVGLVGDGVEFHRAYVVGVCLGLATGVAYGLFVVAVKLSVSTARTPGPAAPDPVTFMAFSAVFSAVFLGPTALIEDGRLLPVDGVGLAKVALLGLTAQAAGWVAISSSLREIPASRAGLILLLQPVLAMVWSALFFGEQLSGWQLAGMALTLAGLYFGGLRG